MDPSLAYRLNSEDPRYDSALFGKCAKVAADYVRNGLQTLNYWLPSQG